MQKNFTHLITAVNRSQNHRAVLTALLLFMLLLLARSASAQTTNPTKPTLTPTSICEGGKVTLQTTYNGTGPGNSRRATSVKWQHSLTGAQNGQWTDVTLSGGSINGKVTNSSFNNVSVTSTLELEPVTYAHRGYYRVRFYKENGTEALGVFSYSDLLTVNQPHSAGIDQVKCATGTATTFKLAGITSNSSYNWTVLDNPNNLSVTIANPQQLNSDVTISGIGAVTLKLSTTNSICGPNTDDVVLTVNPNYTNALRDPSPITIDSDFEYNKPATFIAHTANPNDNVAWTYEWIVNYSGGIADKILTDNNNDATLNLTAAEMNTNFVNVQVIQIAPSGLCVDRPQSLIGNSPNQTPLPVELIYLKADKKNDNIVALEWATAIEQNSEGFEVQVSQDAKNYRTLAFVASKAGGNTNEKQVYTFHDKENGKYGNRYYRLMQRDMNGDAEYFGPKAVTISDVAEGLSAYPNAFTSEVNLEVNAEEAGTMHVLVTTSTGATVLERTVKVAKGNNRALLQFNSSLPQGLYFVTTRLNGKTGHLKLLKK